MKSLRVLFPSAFTFAGALLGRRDPALRRNAQGLTQLEGWSELPEEAVIAQSVAQQAALPRKNRFLLYCYEGPHRTEFFPVRSPQSRAGSSAESEIVLSGLGEAEYVFQLDSDLELRGTAPHAFELNGKAEYHARLVDYDELKLGENRFLVLEIAEAT